MSAQNDVVCSRRLGKSAVYNMSDMYGSADAHTMDAAVHDPQ